MTSSFKGKETSTDRVPLTGDLDMDTTHFCGIFNSSNKLRKAHGVRPFAREGATVHKSLPPIFNQPYLLSMIWRVCSYFLAFEINPFYSSLKFKSRKRSGILTLSPPKAYHAYISCLRSFALSIIWGIKSRCSSSIPSVCPIHQK